MITKKMLLGLSLSSLLAFSATNTFAEVGFCSNVEVVTAGSAIGGLIVKLRSNRNDCTPAFTTGTELHFILDNTTNKGNGMLAAALSAQASGQKVTIITKVPNTYTNMGNLLAVYAQAQDTL